MRMNVRHFVASNRLIDPVKIAGMPDQYWYRFDGNSDADVATSFMRCGRYVDNDGKIEAPVFFAPGDEDDDCRYPSFNSEKVKTEGASFTMLSVLFAELEKEKKDLLIFNFGYENRKEKEYGQLRYLHDRYIDAPGSPLGRVLMITWPSQGFGQYDIEVGKDNFVKRTWNKLFAKEPASRSQEQINNDVKVTGDALAIFLLKLSAFVKHRYKDPQSYQPKINFVAQSMANAILIRCLMRLNELGMQDQVSGLFSRLMLTAPDVPDKVFEKEAAFASGMSIAEKVYVVCSEEDFILKVSDIFHNIAGTHRLGIRGPADMSKVPPNVHLMKIHQKDIRVIPKDWNHRYFVYNPGVVARYLHVFREGLTERTDYLDA